MELVIDPARLTPPAAGEESTWARQIKKLLTLIVDGGVSVSCPQELRDLKYAQWFEEQESIDLLRYFEEFAGRVGNEAGMLAGDALLEQSAVEPAYIYEGLSPEDRSRFVEHLAEAGLAKEDGAAHAGLLTHAESWADESNPIRVDAEIHMREAPGGEWVDLPVDQSALLAYLPRSLDADGVLASCCEYPCQLIENVEFGVRAFGVKVGKEIGSGDFELGPNLVESLNQMNYRRDRRYAQRCLRTMALIAAGRGHEVDGHEERSGSGPENPPAKYNGKTVMRAYLANRTPDANRLFWVRSDPPVFLNVTGHEGVADLTVGPGSR